MVVEILVAAGELDGYHPRNLGLVCFLVDLPLTETESLRPPPPLPFHLNSNCQHWNVCAPSLNFRRGADCFFAVSSGLDWFRVSSSTAVVAISEVPGWEVDGLGCQPTWAVRVSANWRVVASVDRC